MFGKNDPTTTDTEVGNLVKGFKELIVTGKTLFKTNKDGRIEYVSGSNYEMDRASEVITLRPKVKNTLPCLRDKRQEPDNKPRDESV